MNSLLNRRNWLKSTSLITSGLAIGHTLPIVSPSKIQRKAQRDLSFWEWEQPIKERNGFNDLAARLLANENPYGPSPRARKAIINAVQEGNKYGHYYAQKLIEKIAAKEGVPEDHIILAPGSSDLLEKTAVSLFSEGGNVVSADPAYMSLIKSAEAIGGEWNAVPLKADYSHDLDGMKNAINGDTKMVYVCNPNNPTGTITAADKLEEFCREVSKETLVFVDEAYLEFMDDTVNQKSMIHLVQEGENVIVCRTFSKAHGMAGIRVGYIVGIPKTLEMITSTYRGNMGMNITALQGALASIDDDEFIEMSVEKNKMSRDYVFGELDQLGFEYLPSQTSFVLFPIEMEGKIFLEKMYDLKVGVRAFNVFGGNYCRVSMGTMDEMKLFVGALKKVLV